MKRYELIKAITERKIKNNTTIKVKMGNAYKATLKYENLMLKWESGDFDTSILCSEEADFEVIEENKEIEELEEFKIRNTFPFKYFIIDYSIFLKRYVLVNVSLDEERDNGEQWYFVLSDEEGWEYQKEIQEIYGIEDLNYLNEKVNKLNKERECE